MRTPYVSKWTAWKAFVCLWLLPAGLMAQVGIGTTSPNASAVLDLRSTAKGFLAPRLTTAQMGAIASPAHGLMVFNTNADHFYFYNATTSAWQTLSGAATGWQTGGNSVTNPATQWIGTTNAQPFVLRTNSVERLRIGPTGNIGISGPASITSPAATLEVGGNLALRISPVPIPTGYNLTVNPGGYSILLCTLGSDLEIRNIVPGADGAVLLIIHSDVGSSDTFRFLTSGNILTRTNATQSAMENNTPAMAFLVYSQTLGKWVLISFDE